MKTKFILLVAFFALFLATAVSAQNSESVPIRHMTEDFFKKPAIYEVIGVSRKGEIINSSPNMAALITSEIFAIKNLDSGEFMFGESIIQNLETVEVNYCGDMVTRRVYRTEGGLLLSVIASKLKDTEVYALSAFDVENEHSEVMTFILRYVGEWR